MAKGFMELLAPPPGQLLYFKSVRKWEMSHFSEFLFLRNVTFVLIEKRWTLGPKHCSSDNDIPDRPNHDLMANANLS